ncbi:MAG: hypothetical protein AB7U82_28675 [Blastocatellales bacterium]
MPKHKGGRPSKYKPEYCQKLIEFFDIEPYEDKPLEHYGKDGEVKWIDYKRMANKLPTLRGFAKHIEVDISTVYNWISEKHASFQQEFLDAFTQAKELQKWFLIENGLNGCYNPMFAIFTAKNITDMRDLNNVDHTTKGEKIEPGIIKIVAMDGTSIQSQSKTTGGVPVPK